MDSQKQLSRRRALRLSASAAAASLLGGAGGLASAQPAGQEEAAGLGAEDAAAPRNASGDEKFARFILREADEAPLDKERTRLLHARDLANDPLPRTIVDAEGRARVALAGEPMQVVCRLKVPGFGEVYCYADNDGKGYAREGNVDLVADAAATRLRRVREAAVEAKRAGVPSDPELDKHLEAAARPIAKEPGKVRTAAAYEALAHGLHAGERVALNAARHRISRLNGPRTDFRFGVMMSGYDTLPPAYGEAILRAFSQATINWYTWGPEEPPEGRINYDRMERSVQWCEQNKLKPKGFGYCYMSRGATPEWMRPIETADPAAGPDADVSTTKRQFNPRWPWEKIREQYVNVVRQTAERYHGRVAVMEIINEAHDKANLWHLTQAQILDITKATCDAARSGSATVERMINHCCQWGEYAKKPGRNGGRLWSPLRYLDACVKHGVQFEVIGLQLYYPQYDVFETERMVDRHAKFGKPIEITEMATASQAGLDPESMRPKTAAPGWHGEWSESTQADWLEAMYTLWYSKPHTRAVTWWNLADNPGHFWPFGGMLRKDMTPKESYGRLLELQKRWGVAKQA